MGCASAERVHLQTSFHPASERGGAEIETVDGAAERDSLLRPRNRLSGGGAGRVLPGAGSQSASCHPPVPGRVGLNLKA